MSKIFILLFSLTFFSACSSKTIDENITPKLVVGSTLDLTLNDQFEKIHTINSDTKRVIFAFSKKSAHICNDYFSTQKSSYLKDTHSLFIADVSAAPSIIRNLFIMPGLKKHKHTVLIFEDENIAAKYKKGINEENIILITLENKKITKILTLQTKEEFINALRITKF